MATSLSELITGTPVVPEEEAINTPDPDLLRAVQYAEQYRNTKAVTGQAVKKNPDAYAKARNDANTLGTNTDLAESMPTETSQAAAHLRMLRDLHNQGPITNEIFNNLDYATLAQNDVNNIGLLEKGYNTLKNAFGSAAAGPMRMASGLLNVPRGWIDQSRMITRPLDDMFTEDIFSQPYNSIEWQLMKAADYLDTAAESMKPDYSKMGSTEAAVYSGIESASMMLSVLPLAFLTKKPEIALSAMAGTTGGEAYSQAINKGLSPNEALAFAFNQGLAEYVTEKIPLGMLFKGIKNKAGFLRLLGEQLVAENITEQAATLWQDAGEWVFLNPEKTMADFMAERPEAAYQTMIATTVGVILQTGGAKALNRAFGEKSAEELLVSELLKNNITNSILAQEAAARASGFIEVNEAAKLIGVRQTSPEAFTEMNQKLATATGVENVFLQSASTVEDLGEEGMAALEKANPEFAQKLKDGAKTDEIVSLPMVDYVSTIAATDAGTLLAQHLLINPDHMSNAEGTKFFQKQEKEFEEEAEKLLLSKKDVIKLNESTAEVNKIILAGLTSNNRFTKDVNEKYATFMSNFYRTMSARLKITPEELYKRFPLKVAAQDSVEVTKDILSGEGVDASPLLDALRRQGGRAIPAATAASPEVANAPESADAETQATLKELADELERQGVDINTVTNEDANKLLQGFLANQNDESSDISDQQDFGDIILTYPAKVRGTGKTVEISEKAQVVFDQAVKRRTAIESLMECVNA